MPWAPLTSRLGKPRRQDLGFALGLVVIRLKIDGVVVEIVEQRIGDPGEPGLGIAVGRRRIAVHRAEIALTVDQRQAHREILRHPHHRVVDRQFAMRMVFADHIADDARRFAVGAVPLVAVDLHRIKDAAVDRLEPVADVGQCPRHDHAHRVIEVRAPHLVLDRDRGDVRRGGGRRCGGNGQGRSFGWWWLKLKSRPSLAGARRTLVIWVATGRLPHFAARTNA